MDRKRDAGRGSLVELVRAALHAPKAPDHRILGVKFFRGTVHEAVAQMARGGLLVVPAAPALKDVATNPQYREALLNADMAIADSAFMVLIWNLIQRDRIDRLSGLKYLRTLLLEPDVRQSGNTFWIMPSEESAASNTAWLQAQGIDVPAEAVYVAPRYGHAIEDEALLAKLTTLRPQHVIVTVGGGTQERLGLYLKRRLTYLPSIHCIGAAIGFLSGDQVNIPVWADRMYLGWLFRVFSEPSRFLPRYWDARHLLGMIVRYRHELPPLIDRRRSRS